MIKNFESQKNLNKKKILFVALSKEIKTGARYAEDIIRRALGEKYRVKFVYPHHDSVLSKVLFPLQLSFIGYYSLITRKLFDLVITSDNYIFADIVYVQPPAGKDVILTWDEMLFGQKSQFFFRCLSFLTRKHLKLLVSKKSHFITNSQYAKQVVRNNYGKEASVIYPPVPTQLYGEPNKVRENLVITISSLNPKKNLELIAEIGKEVPEAKFILLGYFKAEFEYILESIKAGFIKSGIHDNFLYIPSASDEEKVTLLSKAKVYFHPTHYEPFGISIAEGMAAGCIPVVHNSGGPKEFVPRECRYEDAEGAVRKIRCSLNDWDLERAEKFRSIAIEFREKKFENEIINFVEERIAQKDESRSRARRRTANIRMHTP